MPFTNVGSGVASCFENLRQRDFPLQQMRILTGVVNPTVNARANMMSTGQQDCSRRRTNGATGVEIGKANSPRRQTIDRWSFHWAVITTDVLIAQIVRQQHDDIRLRTTTLGKGGNQSDGEQKREREVKELLFHDAILSSVSRNRRPAAIQ